MSPPPSLHILVIEDNDSLREATVDFLNHHGHRATGVVSAEEVEDTPTRHIPDLYLIDVNLPGEDGFSLAERIRRNQPKAGIVLMTARSQLSDRLEGYSSGADNYLIKPVEQAELLACIQNLGVRLRPAEPSALLLLELDSQALCLKGPAGKVAVTHGESMLLAGLIRAAGNNSNAGKPCSWSIQTTRGWSPPTSKCASVPCAKSSVPAVPRTMPFGPCGVWGTPWVAPSD